MCIATFYVFRNPNGEIRFMTAVKDIAVVASAVWKVPYEVMPNEYRGKLFPEYQENWKINPLGTGTVSKAD